MCHRESKLDLMSCSYAALFLCKGQQRLSHNAHPVLSSLTRYSDAVIWLCIGLQTWYTSEISLCRQSDDLVKVVCCSHRMCIRCDNGVCQKENVFILYEKNTTLTVPSVVYFLLL